MACHYAETGHTKLIVGASYVRWLRWCAPWDWSKLVSMNEATGMAVIKRDGHTQYVRLSELSNWHMVQQ